ncbi:5-methylcytosine-specific restriction enzyme subunit McrC [Rhodococcus coprophilus]|uniref:5-methylcytosine-specific restriction enzyme subunit McrC n=2 Tax=Rhodococcus coprophilus TaxID=38310 RepID=A0A2X4TR72_9NOCA|nr:5-methylcytosine-specific restriction enzyme subunit McrC [Rhodococcus coprophilus]
MKIPIRNLWLLQLFASDLYRHHGHEFAGAERIADNLPQLVAQMLADEVETRLHMGLSVGFTRTVSDLHRVRGRIDVLGTTRHRLLERGLVRCRYDTLVTDTVANRLVRSALRAAATSLPHHPRFRSLALQLEVAGVTGPAPRPDIVPSLRRQRLLARDHRMLSLAELLLTMSIPDPGQDKFVTVAPEDSDRYLRRLFERAVYGFYHHTLGSRGWSVEPGTRLSWSIDRISEGMQAVLPGMYTDITLRAPLRPGESIRRRIVVDTKFTAITQAGYHRPTTLNSGHLYQIYAYLMSQQERSDDHRHAEGLMLHPVVDGHFDEDMVIQTHRIRFATVDLRASGETIAAHLIRATSRGSHSETVAGTLLTPSADQLDDDVP